MNDLQQTIPTFSKEVHGYALVEAESLYLHTSSAKKFGDQMLQSYVVNGLIPWQIG